MRYFLLLLTLVASWLAGYAETWSPVGQVKWTEGALTGQSSDYRGTWTVSVERSDERPKVYRLQPYSNHKILNSSSYRTDNVYVYLHCEDANAVYIEYYVFNYYYYNYYNDCYYHVYQRCPENGFDSKYYGKITNGTTIEFPVGAFAVDDRGSSSKSTPSSIAKYSTYTHVIEFPEGVLDYTPMEETWINVGEGQWEDCWAVNVSGEPYTCPVKVEKSALHPNHYRVAPYGEQIIIDADDSSKVYISAYDKTSSGSTYTFTQDCSENGLSGSYYGTLSDGKVTISGDSFIFCLKDGDGSSWRCSSNRNCIITFPDGFDNPIEDEGGVFMGIVAFNDELHTKPISALNRGTMADFTSFVDDLEMANATLLYYAVDQSINRMSTQTFPDDLGNAVLITFTDGLDQGSLAMEPQHRKSRTYASYLSDRIASTSIQGCPLQAYTIGLMGQDVVDEDLFRFNLSCLSSADPDATDETEANNKYIAYVTDVKGLEDKLTSLYEDLNKQTSQRVITIKVPMMSHEDLYRFTLDGSHSDATESQLWFEGTFNIDNKQLENVTYNGFTSSCGTTIQTVQDGIYLSFDVTDCRTPDGELLPVAKDNIHQWVYIPSREKWQPNIEDEKAGDIKVDDIHSSLAIMFALDCSTSLSEDKEGKELFPKVKQTAKNFIQRLAGNAAGIESVEVDSAEAAFDMADSEVEFYNLQGMRVSQPSRGIYICRKGGKACKVMVP